MKDEIVFVNERPVRWQRGETAADLRARYASGADLVILNGFPIADPNARKLEPGDRLVLIRRGEVPPADALAVMMTARNSPGVAERLRQTCVGIAGLGGLGSNLAVALARIGVGRLVLADYDVVEPSNLNRQFYFTDQLGQPKTEATAANLARVNPNTALVLHNVRLEPDNVGTIFAGVDVLAECFDQADQKQMLIETALVALPGIPLVAVSGIAGYGDSNAIRVRRRGARLWLIGDGESAAAAGRGLMSPRVFQAVGMQANTILRLLLGAEQERDPP